MVGGIHGQQLKLLGGGGGESTIPKKLMQFCANLDSYTTFSAKLLGITYYYL
jgi:hypothetical protein